MLQIASLQNSTWTPSQNSAGTSSSGGYGGHGSGFNVNGVIDNNRYIHGMIHSMVCAVVDERLRGLIELAEDKTIDATALDEFLNSLKIKDV